MKNRSRSFVSMGCAVLAGTLLGVSAVAAELPQYQLIDLWPAGQQSHAVDLNDSGQVVVAGLDDEGNNRLFVYSSGQVADLITVPSGGYVSPIAINELGHVIGSYYRDSVTTNFVYKNGAMVNLDSFNPRVINDRGVIAGTAPTASGGGNAALYDDGVVTLLGTLGGSYSYPYDINNAGQVTGVSSLGDGGDSTPPQESKQAFLWDGSTLVGIGPAVGWRIGVAGFDINEMGWVLIGLATSNSDLAYLWDGSALTSFCPNTNRCSAVALNDLGQVVGSYSDFSVPNLPRYVDFIWFDGEMQAFSESVDVTPIGINNAGEVVGNYYPASSEGRAFVYTGGLMKDVGTLGGDYSYAEAINLRGQVVGSSRTADGKIHAFLATPISLLFSNLLNDVTGVGPGKSLANSVNTANTYYAANDLQATCAALDYFANQVNNLSKGKKPKIAPTQAAEFIEDGQAIQDAVGCP